jgi:hypothetical protein
MTKTEFANILKEDYKYEVKFLNDIPMVIFRDHMDAEDISIVEGIAHDVGFTGSYGTKRIYNGYEYRGVIHMNEEENGNEEIND